MSDQYTPDFQGIQAQAAAMFDADNAPEATPETPVTPEVAVAPETAVVAPVVEPEAVEELDPETHGDRLMRVKVDGEWKSVKLREAANGYSRTSHYTKQSQELAAQRKEVEAIQQKNEAFAKEREELTQLRTFLGNPNAVFAALQKHSPELFQLANTPTANLDANDIATVQQAKDLIAQQAKEFKQTLAQMQSEQEAKAQEREAQRENKAQTAKYSEAITPVVKQLFEKHPLLSKVRRAEDILRYEVAQLQPKNLEETLEAFRTVAQGMEEDLNDGFTTVNKTKITQAAKLAVKGIEPPGGSGPQIQPTASAYDKATRKMNWKSLEQRAQSIMDEAG